MQSEESKGGEVQSIKRIKKGEKINQSEEPKGGEVQSEES
jgi:hypothetical protein